MEANIYALSGQRVYGDALRYVANEGSWREVRGRRTLDSGFTTILLESPMEGMPLRNGRHLNPAIGAAEALQLIGGFSDAGLMTKISANFKQFLNGDEFHGAYGARIKHQMIDVAWKLHKEPATRQAVVTLWDPVLDNLEDMADYPCTVMLQFQVEEGKLCMNVVMRSNDAWLGLPYDMFQFTQLQLTLARCLGLAYGWYRHTALSLHLYEDDLPKIHEIEYDGSAAFQPLGIGFLDRTPFMNVMKRARRLACGMTVEGMTRSEVWYRDALASYLG